MLSKEECVKLSQSILNALPDHEFIDRLDDAVFNLNKQAQLAIELQAKLDAIERWATASVQFDDFGYQMARDSVLQILRGDE